MTPRRATRTGASPREPLSRTSRTRGSARSAEPASATSSCTRIDQGVAELRDAASSVARVQSTPRSLRPCLACPATPWWRNSKPRAGVSDWEALLAFDREHVWHPYGALPGAQAPLPVVSAEGVRLKLADGRELIDGMSSWWCAIHGYRHPALDAAVQDQLGRMAHVMFGGLTHEPAVRLAARLSELTPAGLDRVFFADSGSVSVEVAIKLSLQFQRAIGHPERTR